MPAVNPWWRGPHLALIDALTFHLGPSRTIGEAREVEGTWATPLPRERWRFGSGAGFPRGQTLYTPCHGPAPIGELDYVAKSALPLEWLHVLDPSVREGRAVKAFEGVHLPRLHFTRCTLYPATLVLLWRELAAARLCPGTATGDAKPLRWLLSIPAETATRLRMILTLAPDMDERAKRDTFLGHGAPRLRP